MVEQYLSFTAPAGFRDELINGEIILSPDPKALHQEVAHRICRLLERKLKRSGLLARQRTNMQMPQDDSMPSPDVVEVISRPNTKKNVSRKTVLYLKNGASAVWIVYPQKKVVHVTTPESTTIVGIDESLPLGSPLPVSSLAVKDIFALTTENL